ncbi:MAG: LytTR family DNA-binding domain-containing protein [Litorimonas sp.]
MKLEAQHLGADKRADRIAYSFVAVFTLLSWVVLSNTEQLENVKSGNLVIGMEPWLSQGTSHLAILLTILIIPFMLSRWPITLENWKRMVPVYTCGFVIFGAIHIILMDVFRTVSFPHLLGRPYYENLFDIKLWIYELSKDAYTYLLVLSVFVTGRHIEQLQLEAKQARNDAKNTGRITLKSGGRIVFLQADEIIWVEAAANYLDIHTDTGHHLVRMTLTMLERLLAEADSTHIRIHRSYLVKREVVQEIRPIGNGRTIAKLKNGQSLSVSRKYRDQF